MWDRRCLFCSNVLDVWDMAHATCCHVSCFPFQLLIDPPPLADWMIIICHLLHFHCWFLIGWKWLLSSVLSFLSSLLPHALLLLLPVVAKSFLLASGFNMIIPCFHFKVLIGWMLLPFILLPSISYYMTTTMADSSFSLDNSCWHVSRFSIRILIEWEWDCCHVLCSHVWFLSDDGCCQRLLWMIICGHVPFFCLHCRMG